MSGNEYIEILLNSFLFHIYQFLDRVADVYKDINVENMQFVSEKKIEKKN